MKRDAPKPPHWYFADFQAYLLKRQDSLLAKTEKELAKANRVWVKRALLTPTEVQNLEEYIGLLQEKKSRCELGGITRAGVAEYERIYQETYDGKFDQEGFELHGDLWPAFREAMRGVWIAGNLYALLKGTFSSPETPKVVVSESLGQLLHTHECLPLPSLKDPIGQQSRAMEDRLLPSMVMVVRLPAIELRDLDGEFWIRLEEIEMWAFHIKYLINNADALQLDVGLLSQFHPATSFVYALEAGARFDPDRGAIRQAVVHTGPTLPGCRAHFPFQDAEGGLSFLADKLFPALLEFWNEPSRTLVQRAGRRFVNPEKQWRRQNLGRAQRVRYEYWGESLSIVAPTGIASPSSSPAVRTWVRGHWARWPILPQGDPLRWEAEQALPTLEDPGPAAGATLETFTNALHAALGDRVVGRAADVVQRLLCTWDVENTQTPGLHPLHSCPWWTAHRDTLWPQLRSLMRRRRSYVMPHWRGPADAPVVDAFTFTDKA